MEKKEDDKRLSEIDISDILRDDWPFVGRGPSRPEDRRENDPMSNFQRSAEELYDTVRGLGLASEVARDGMGKLSSQTRRTLDELDRVYRLWGKPSVRSNSSRNRLSGTYVSGYGYGARDRGHGYSSIEDILDEDDVEYFDDDESIEEERKRQKEEKRLERKAKAQARKEKFKSAISAFGRGAVKVLKSVVKASGYVIAGVGYVVNKIGKGLVKKASMVKPKDAKQVKKASNSFKTAEDDEMC